MQTTQEVPGIVIEGARIASGFSKTNPFPGGTIQLQIPFFAERGLNLFDYYRGTINVSIAPSRFSLVNPRLTFRNVKWVDQYPAEDFSFADLEIVVRGSSYSALLYYPHPATKLGFAKSDSVMELLSGYVKGLQYGDRVVLLVDSQQLRIFL